MARKPPRPFLAMLIPVLALPLLWIGPSAAQPQTGPTSSTGAPPDAPALEPPVMETLRRMSDLLKHARSFTFTYRTAHEQVAQTGQIVDFFHVSKVALTRPNKLRIDVTGDLRNTILRYDGKVVTLFDPTQGFFAQLEAPPTIDATLMLLMEKFQTSFPVAGVLLADPYDKIRDGLNTAVDLGTVEVDGVNCRHLLFGEDDADWQLWVEEGARPLPRRLSIVYKKAPGAPRMLASFSDWNLNASVPAGRFVFVKPPRATQIEFKAAPRGQ